MSVKAKKRVEGRGRLEYAVKAADLLNAEHPLNKTFVEWCGDTKPTKRQGRKFLQQFPYYREVVLTK